MKVPQKITPKDGSDYLRVMTKAVFQAGLNWSVIEHKWPGFEEAFDRFDVYKVATYDHEKISALKQDDRIVKNSSKINATIYNAQTIIDKINQYGDFKKYLSSFDSYEQTAQDLKKSFKWLGDFGIYYFLHVVGQPVPAYEDWAAARGVQMHHFKHK